MGAKTANARERFARRGLAVAAPIDPTTQAMLLRQLYLACFEQERWADAHGVAKDAIELDVLPDVLHQDAARAALAMGEVDDALVHLRAASRKAPADRRAFHYWTLGSTLFLLHRYADAESALNRAVRWGTHDQPLYRAQLALVQIAAGKPPPASLQTLIDELASAPCGQGYGRFVLGHLAYAAGAFPIARRYLDAFVRKIEAGPKVQALSLAGELAMARATLEKTEDDA